jgi:hypothetical protein
MDNIEMWVVGMLGIAGAIAARFAKPASTPFTPDPHNDKQILVRGWSADEMPRMLTDLKQLYLDKLGPDFAFNFNPEADGTFRVTPSRDVPGELFPFLVNWLQYPNGFEPNGRTILVVGKTTLSSDFSIPDPALTGQRAVFYVPANDTDYDVVYIRIGDVTYRYSFAGFGRWKRTDDARLPAGFAALAD